MKRVLALLLSMALSLALLTGCGEKSDVKKLFRDYEDACRSMDVEAIADCFNPAVVGAITGGIMGAFGLDKEALFGLLSGVIYFTDTYYEDDVSEMLESYRITPVGYAFNDEKDECDVTAESSYLLCGEETNVTNVFHCEKYRDEWYIFSVD